MVTSQRVINSHRKKLLWISIGAVEALLLLVGLIALVVYLNEAPIVPSRDALDPLPSELREVASFVAENNGGGRVPSDLYMVLESRKGGSLQDGLDQLVMRRGFDLGEGRPTALHLLDDLLGSFVPDERLGVFVPVLCRQLHRID